MAADRPSPSSQPSLTLNDIREAAARIAPFVRRTPVLVNEWLDEMAGASLFFKGENLQHVGAFKARGATNAVLRLSDEAAARGVVTHSSGNHAAAVARAARLRGVPAWIVMPEGSAAAKVANVRRFGGEVIFCAPTLAAREAAAAAIVAERGAAFVHPFDNLDVMAGQGTAALELLDEVPDLDVVVCPVGGGGLLSGTAVAVKGVRPGAQVVAAEPALADDAARSLAAGRVEPVLSTATIADGLRTSLSERTFAVIRASVDEVVTVPEAAIVAAMRVLWGAAEGRGGAVRRRGLCATGGGAGAAPVRGVARGDHPHRRQPGPGPPPLAGPAGLTGGLAGLTADHSPPARGRRYFCQLPPPYRSTGRRRGVAIVREGRGSRDFRKRQPRAWFTAEEGPQGPVAFATLKSAEDGPRQTSEQLLGGICSAARRGAAVSQLVPPRQP